MVHFDQRPYAPVLVIVPPSVIANWLEHFKLWGHFSVHSFGEDRTLSINRLKLGTHDILLYPNSLLREDCKHLVLSVDWKLVIIDEYHTFKNHKTKSYQFVMELRDHCMCPLLGLTGTIMQNNYMVSSTISNCQDSLIL